MRKEPVGSLTTKMNFSENQLLLVLAFLTGLGSGFAAVILKTLIHLICKWISGLYQLNTGFPWSIILPGIGMLISLLLVKYVIRSDISHGVTKVLHAISKKESRILPHNMFSSVLTSSVTIGFGGSVGAEAPIVYTGAAIGSNIGRYFNLSYRSVTILLGCGAAGAVAGIFKAPMAGILFTLEILLFNISAKSILPLLTSSVTATTVSYVFLGNDVSFSSTIDNFLMGNIPYYILLGVLCGIMSLYFIRMTMYLEDRIHSVQNAFLRWFLCSVALGILLYCFPPLYGEGYDSLTQMLNGNPAAVSDGTMFAGASVNSFSNHWRFLLFFFLVMVLKVFSMSFTNAGGGVGGTFGPTLIVGGLAGFVMARFINLSGVHVLPEVNFVLVGMGGLMAGVMSAPMTAIFLIAEITGGYSLLMPLIITSLVSYATIRFFEPYSIYSKRLAKIGELLTHDSDSAVLTLLKTSSMIEKDFITLEMEDDLGKMVRAVKTSKRNLFPVVDRDGVFQGYISLNDIRQIMFDRSKYNTVFAYNLMAMSPDYILEDEKMDSVMEKFERTDAWNLPVLDVNKHYIGFVSKSKIFSSYRDQLRQVSQE